MEREAAPTRMTEAAPPSLGRVAGQAAIKGLVGLPESVLNAPVNLWNLGKAGVGTAAIAAGYPEFGANIEMTPTPNFITRGLEKVGVLRPEYEPRTGGQRILSTAIQGGTGLALSPAKTLGQFAGNIATGLTSGAAAGVTTEATGSELAGLAVGAATPLGARAVQGTKTVGTPVRAETLKEAQQAGYVVPPSTVNPTFVNQRLESLAGKAAVGQEAAIRNQQVTNALAAKALGLPAKTALTEAKLKSVRTEAAQPYRDVAALSPRAEVALEKLKDARFQANAHAKHYDRSADPAALAKSKDFASRAETLEKVIEKEATKSGRPEIVAALREARSKIAKTYDVERALNVGDANVSAAIIGRQLDKAGLKAKTGELATVGKFAEAFPSVAREGGRVPSPGVSGTDAAAAAMLGTMGYGAAGGPMGLLAAGLPLVRGPARSLVLSRPYQRMMATPRELQPFSDAALRSLLVGRAIAERNQ